MSAWLDPEELRVQIHRYLREYPERTAYQIALGLRMPNPQGSGKDRVLTQLRRMLADGEAIRATGPRAPGDQRPTVRWAAS